MIRVMPILYFLSFVPLGMIFPYLVTEFEMRQVHHIGILLAMPSFVMILVGPVWGWIADWMQQTVRVLQSAIWISVVGLLCLVSLEAEWVWVGMLLYSLGWAPVPSLIDAMTLENLRQQSDVETGAESNYGSIRQWGSIGYMVGVGLIGLAIGWGIVAGAIVTTVLGIYVMTLPKMKVDLPQPEWHAVKQLLQKSELLWILLCAGLHFSVHLGNSSYIVKHAQVIGVAPSVASIAISLGVVVEIIVFQQAVRFEQYAPDRLLVWSCLLAIPRWGLMMVATEAWMLILAQATHGITFGVFWLATVRLVKAVTPPELSSTGQSLLSTAVGGVGAVAGMYGASWLVEVYNTQTFYGVATGIAILATLGSMRVKWQSNHS